MQKTDPVNFTPLSHDAQFTQDAHDSEGLEKGSHASSKSRKQEREDQQVSSISFAWLVDSENIHISVLADRLHRHLNSGSGLMSVNAVLLSCPRSEASCSQSCCDPGVSLLPWLFWTALATFNCLCWLPCWLLCWLPTPLLACYSEGSLRCKTQYTTHMMHCNFVVFHAGLQVLWRLSAGI